MNKLFIPAFVVAFASASSCGNDTSCSIDADCFQGEVCVDERCEIGSNSDSNNTPNNVSNTANNEANNTPSNEPNNTGGSNNVSGDCVVSRVGNSCTEDAIEAEEGLTTAPVLWDSQSWCDGETLLTTQTSDTLTLCAGDDGDYLRFFIDNRNPNECVTQQFTWTAEIRLKTPCMQDLLDIQPYFITPGPTNPCEDRPEDWRCEWTDDQTFRIDYVRQPTQTMDWSVLIRPVDGREDIQVDYDIVMTITQ